LVDLPDARYRVKLIVGLGNPGDKYKGTRHNLGFEVVDEVARRRDLSFSTSPADAVIARETGTSGRLMLAKPLTFMNRSGAAVGGLSRYFDVETSDILVVLDDVNLSLGRLRARPDGSDGGHNGLQSVILSLGTREFPRLRMGVGRGVGQRDLADHVLTRFTDEEVVRVKELIIETADAVELFIKSGITQVMNRFNGLDRATEVMDEEA